MIEDEVRVVYAQSYPLLNTTEIFRVRLTSPPTLVESSITVSPLRVLEVSLYALWSEEYVVEVREFFAGWLPQGVNVAVQLFGSIMDVETVRFVPEHAPPHELKM